MRPSANNHATSFECPFIKSVTNRQTERNSVHIVVNDGGIIRRELFESVFQARRKPGLEEITRARARLPIRVASSGGVRWRRIERIHRITRQKIKAQTPRRTEDLGDA